MANRSRGAILGMIEPFSREGLTMPRFRILCGLLLFPLRTPTVLTFRRFLRLAPQ